MAEDLKGLIAHGRKQNYIPGNYSSLWDDLLEDPIDAIPDVARRIRSFHHEVSQSLRGNVLVDLGSGYPTTGITEFLRRAQLAKYIVVDLHWDSIYPDHTIDIPNTTVEVVPNTDMLEYVVELPDNFGNFMICGIDTNVIDSRPYHQYLALMLMQKTSPNGLIITSNSEVSRFFFQETQRLKRLGWRKDFLKEDYTYSHHIFKKIK